jgi:hypothetical protein
MSEQPDKRVNPRVARRRRMVRFLWASVAVVAVLALSTLAVPAGETRNALGGAAVAALVIAPVARVAWLALRWLRLGDPKFAAVAGGLVAVFVIAALAT